MDKQSFLSARYPDIIPSHKVIVFIIFIGNKHIDIVKLMSL